VAEAEAEAEAAVRRMARIREPLRLQSNLGKWTRAFPTRFARGPCTRAR